MPPNEEIVDLTLSDSEADTTKPAKRSRRAATAVKADSDVVCIESDGPGDEADGGVDLGDADLAIVSAAGEVWNSDLPHGRHTCGVHAFCTEHGTSNAAHCAKCFCYICDAPAAGCTSWGTGIQRSDHCNAHPGSAAAKELRRARANPPADHATHPRNLHRALTAGEAGLSACLAAGSERSCEDMEGEEEEDYGVWCPECTCPCIAHSPAAPNCTRHFCSLGGEYHPDEYRPDEYHSDEVAQEYEYPTTTGYNIQAQRDRERRLAAATAAAAKPVICNYTEMPDPESVPGMIELVRLSLPCKTDKGTTIVEVGKRLAPHGFYRKDTHEPYDPVTMQRTVNSYAERLHLENLCATAWDRVRQKNKRSPLSLRPMDCGPAPTPPGPSRVRAVTVVHFDGRAPPTTFGVTVPAEATVADIMAAAEPLSGGLNGTEHFLAVSVDGKRISRWMAATNKVTDREAPTLKMVLYRVPKPPAFSVTAQDPQYTLVQLVKPQDEEAPTMPHHRQLCLPLLLPLAKKDASGGIPARKRVAAAVVAAIKPFFLETGDGAAAAATAMAATMEISRSSVSGYNSELRAFEHFSPYAAHIAGERSFHEGRIHLAVNFEAEQLLALDVDAMAQPVTDPSASPEALAATLEYIRAMKAHKEEVARAEQLPYMVLDELHSASATNQPGTVVISFNHASRHNPVARYKLQLTPASKRKSERDGTLAIRVFVWKDTSLGGLRHFFKTYDVWEVNPRSGRHHYFDHIEPPHLLKHTMRVGLRDHAPYSAMRAEMERCGRKDAELTATGRSISGLMQAMERGESPAVAQPPGLTVTMRPYQLQSLHFMTEAERGEGGFRRRLWLPLTTVSGQRYWYSPVLGRACLTVPEQPWGGFCCEEMGLGKTVEVLGLCLANPAPPLAPNTAAVVGERTLIKSRATLVVCAVSLVGQWIEEAKSKTEGSIRIHMYHGQTRIKNGAHLANNFDLVVTTYATLVSDWGGKGGNAAQSPLHKVYWHRLVLDESHTAKNPAVGHTKACVALEADRRWCCTGTPINTDVADLYGQFAVLRLAPYNLKTFFDSRVKNAFGNSLFAGGCTELMYTLGQIMVRHTKRQVLGGEEVLRLPPKSEELVPVVLTAQEQQLYRETHARSAAIFKQYRDRGPFACSKNLLQIMALLLPMRRICSGGSLRPADLQVPTPVFDGVGRSHGGGGGASSIAARDPSLVAPDGDECAVCMDAYEDPVITSCHHWFCKECILGALQAVMQPRCPLCRNPQTALQLRSGVTAAEAGAAAVEAAAAAAAAAAGEADAGAAVGVEAAEEAVQPGGSEQSESKLQAMLKKLREMRRADPSAKALIFSQYAATIEWLKVRLTMEGFGHRHISGSMPLKQRAKSIAAFQADPPTTVFLLSMRAGAVGINLTAASHVFLLEPALNPALEDQAIGRAWRMGQKREVKVLRFYVQGSVEERIMEVGKQRMSAAAGGSAAAAAAAAEEAALHHRGNARARQAQYLAGSIRADKQNLRLSELEVLFQDPALPEPRVPADDPSSDEEDAQQQQQRVEMEWDPAQDEAGTSRQHAAQAVQAHTGRRIRRSKAGIAALRAQEAAAAAAAAAGNGATPDRGEAAAEVGDMQAAATPATAAVTNGAHRLAAVAGAGSVAWLQESGPLVDPAPARVKATASASGRLSPASRQELVAPPAAAAAAGGSAPASVGSGSAAVAEHLRRPTPTAPRALLGPPASTPQEEGAGAAGLSSRTGRRAVKKRNYAEFDAVGMAGQ